MVLIMWDEIMDMDDDDIEKILESRKDEKYELEELALEAMDAETLLHKSLIDENQEVAEEESTDDEDMIDIDEVKKELLERDSDLDFDQMTETEIRAAYQEMLEDEDFS